MLNTVVELVVGQNARLRYVCGQDMNEKSWIFGAQRAEVDRDGTLDWVALGFGSARGKVRMETLLAGEGADAKVTGAYAPHARQHIDFDTTQEHGAANTTSDLAFRGILADRSTAVWRGMIKVDPGAQQTDAFQECRNLLLSKRAHADAIPGLEILANDVRCTHAAAIAQIDKEQLFYLRSRGLGEPPAQAARDRGLHGRAGRALRGGPDPRGPRRRRSSAGSRRCWTDPREGGGPARAFASGRCVLASTRLDECSMSAELRPEGKKAARSEDSRPVGTEFHQGAKGSRGARR